MSTKTLQVKHTTTYTGTPLACIDRLPGDGAELTPTQLRQLAATLLTIADECEILYDTTRRQIPVRREYPVEA